jgi:hypothetical protein
MKLTSQQIQHLDNYLISCDIKWIDVRAELVDHFASSLEKKLEENPTLDFKNAAIKVHKSFSDNGFKKLLETKKKSVEKQFYKQLFSHLKSFFKLPKVILSLGFFYGLVLLMNLFSNKEMFFQGLTIIVLLIVLLLLVRILIDKKKKQKRFLTLDKTELYFQLYNFLMILFSSTTTFRPETSFTNTNYNYIHIAAFVLLILFYWCGEHVYFMNKEFIQKQYSKIAV